MGEFPSGQRGQTVNLLRFASMVRIRPPPPQKFQHQMVLEFLYLGTDSNHKLPSSGGRWLMPGWTGMTHYVSPIGRQHRIRPPPPQKFQHHLVLEFLYLRTDSNHKLPLSGGRWLMPGWTGMTHYVSPIGRDSTESVLPHHKNSNTVWYSTISSVPVVSRSTC